MEDKAAAQRHNRATTTTNVEKKKKRRLLYGRDAETVALRKCWADSFAQQPVAVVLLVTGPSGSGKRTWVETTLGSVIESTPRIERGVVVTAVCGAVPAEDRCLRSSTQLFTESAAESPSLLVSPPNHNVFLDAIDYVLQSMDHETLHSFQTKVLPLHFPIQSDWESLTELIPTLLRTRIRDENNDAMAISHGHWTHLNDNPSSGAVLPKLESRPPVAKLLARFLWALSTCCGPIAIILDHAQYIDTDTIDTLQSILRSQNCMHSAIPPSKGLMIALCYRNDTVMSDPLASFLGQVVEDAGKAIPCNDESRQSSMNRPSDELPIQCDHIQKFHISNLSRNDVHEWIRDNCRDDSDETVREATNLIMGVTNGNPRFVQYLLNDLDSFKGKVPLTIEEAYMQLVSQCGSVARNIVETIAAIRICGNHTAISIRLLEMVIQQDCADITSRLVDIGLLEVEYESLLRFPNHELLLTAYNYIPECDRAVVHLRIGRRIWKYSSLGTDDENINDGMLLYTVTQHLYRGIDLVTDAVERGMLASIFLRTGKKAMQSSLFACAASHFECVISVLGTDLWNDAYYDISLDVHNCAAEAYYCIGNFENMDHMLEAVYSNATCFRDKLQAYVTSVHANGARHRLHDAVTTALRVLGDLGVPIPANPSKRVLLTEYLKTRWMLRGKSDRYFLNLPPVTNPDKIAAITLLNFTFMYAYVFKLECAAMALFRTLQLTNEYGITGAAVPAFGQFGFLLCSLGYVREGYRFGQIALSLLHQMKVAAWLPRIYVVVHGIINPWIRPIRESFVPLQLAHRSALKTGDMEGSVISATLYFMLAFYSGAPLPTLEAESRSVLRVMDSMGQVTGLIFLFPLWNLFLDFTVASTLEPNEAEEVEKWREVLNEEKKEKNKIFASQENIWRTIYYCFMGEYEHSVAMAREARLDLIENDSTLDFYQGLSSLALARNGRGLHRCKLIGLGRRALKNYVRWARICPPNFRNRESLLRAELACLRGDYIRAQSLYNTSIWAARESGMVHEEGLAYERFAEHHASLGHINSALPYYTFALEAYSRWGAASVVRRIQNMMSVKFGKLYQVTEIEGTEMPPTR